MGWFTWFTEKKRKREKERKREREKGVQSLKKG
jgi:hypothetical protein